MAIVEDSGMINGPEGRKLSEPHMEEWQQLGFSSATVLPGLKIGFYGKSDYLGRRTFFLLYSFFFFRFFFNINSTFIKLRVFLVVIFRFVHCHLLFLCFYIFLVYLDCLDTVTA